LTTFDVEKNEILIKENINQMQEWAQSNKLDFIKLLEEYKDEVNSGNVQAVQRFWGWGSPVLSSECIDGRRNWIQYYYVVGIKTSRTRQVIGFGGEGMYAPCE